MVETTASKSSDILLYFREPQHTWAFLDELKHNTDKSDTKFEMNFVTLRENHVEKNEQPFDMPNTTSKKQRYVLEMLYSMGYVFQDKYSKQLHDHFCGLDNEQFIQMCYYLKEKLEEDHCYNLEGVFDKFIADTKGKCKEEQCLSNGLSFLTGCITITPLRLLYQKEESHEGNRALRAREFGEEDTFLLVRIREEDGQALHCCDSSIQVRLRSKILHGIRVMGRTYRFFGASNSQLREMSLWFIANENRSVEEAWKVFGDFSAINNVATFIARIGLYFTTSRETQVN
jgi:hypothetical protein